MPSLIPGLSTKDLEILSGPTKSSWSAVIVNKPNGGHFIICNNSHAPTRRESDLMHELAHFICQHEASSIDIHPALGLPLRKHNQEQEDEAECLGASLQLPAKALERALSQGMGLDEIAKHYTASPSMTKFRLNMSGLAKRYGLFSKADQSKW